MILVSDPNVEMINIFLNKFYYRECFCYQVKLQIKDKLWIFLVPVCGPQNPLNLGHLDVVVSVGLEHLITSLDKTSPSPQLALAYLVNSDESSLEGVEAGGVQHLLLDGRRVRAPTQQKYLGLVLTENVLNSIC